jgi:hypothetical protein
MATADPGRTVEVRKLNVFISYASEDAVLAGAVNQELKTAFSQIKTTLDSEIKYGDDWRSRLQEALREADVLLIVATGRQKLSHSYTGFEVGFFSALKLEKRDMEDFRSERLIIPIGIVETLPEGLRDIQSLNLTKALTPFLVDYDTLRDSQRLIESIESNSTRNPLLKLFMQLNKIVQTLYPADDDFAEDLFKTRARESANRLYKTFFQEFQNRVFIEKFPERKIIVRLPSNVRIEPTGDLPPETTLEFIGGSFEIFRINPPADRTVTWASFVQKIPHDDTSTAWTDIIRSLIVTAKQDDFAENRRLLASSDRKRFFRLFVSRSVVYYSGITELHIYIVEVKSRDYGDPTSTMLLKAISVGMMYRSLFLEGEDSQFSPATIRATLAQRLPGSVSELLQELDYVQWLSMDAGLYEPRSIALFLPNAAPGELERRFREWENLRSDLRSSALNVLRAANDGDREAAKTAFEKSLDRFCSSTKPMNREFLGNVLTFLEEIVRKTDEAVVSSPAAAAAAGAPVATTSYAGM